MCRAPWCSSPRSAEAGPRADAEGLRIDSAERERRDSNPAFPVNEQFAAMLRHALDRYHRIPEIMEGGELPTRARTAQLRRSPLRRSRSFDAVCRLGAARWAGNHLLAYRDSKRMRSAFEPVALASCGYRAVCWRHRRSRPPGRLRLRLDRRSVPVRARADSRRDIGLVASPGVRASPSPTGRRADYLRSATETLRELSVSTGSVTRAMPPGVP